MRSFITVMSFVGSYAFLFAFIAGFFAVITPATFFEITSHPAYLVFGSFFYLFAAGYIADDVYERYGQA